MPRNKMLLLILGAIGGGVVGAFAVRTNFHTPEMDRAFARAMPSILLWIVFSLYWTYAARNSGATSKGESTGSTATHQILLNVAMLLLILPIPGLMQQLLPASLAFEITGVVLQIGFIGLAAWARVHLGRNWAAEVRIAEGHELVKSGPYRWLRHPIYTAMLGMFVATAIATGQLHSVIATVLMAVVYQRKIRLEENILRETFGPQFDDYRRDTWALVPLLF
jgi:protein-S-isoprenylcysteine O-methyltransferase Ste14